MSKFNHLNMDNKSNKSNKLNNNLSYLGGNNRGFETAGTVKNTIKVLLKTSYLV